MCANLSWIFFDYLSSTLRPRTLTNVTVGCNKRPFKPSFTPKLTKYKKKKNKKIKQQAWKSVETVVLSSTQIRCEALTSFHICWLCGNVRTQDTSLIWIRVRNHLNWHFESFESQCYLINIVLPTATTCKYSSFYSFAVYEKLQQNVDLVPVPKLVISKQLQDHTGGTRCVHS